ncbi:MAG: aspartate carbamoyltransferase regulatory subunit [Candidatus Freyarchaeota archaeon]
MTEKELRVRKIRDGTVIDHISAGTALEVLKILGLTGKEGHTISILINTPSSKLGKKDVVKIEGRELDPKEVDKIALISPRATINIIRNYEVVEKQRVSLPPIITGFPKCVNPNCIMNSREPAPPSFTVVSKDPVRIRCRYCGVIMEFEDILANL